MNGQQGVNIFVYNSYTLINKEGGLGVVMFTIWKFIVHVCQEENQVKFVIFILYINVVHR